MANREYVCRKERLINMCYKAEVQKRNEEKLNKMLKNENVPDFIQDYFLSISSRAARINYWTTIRNTLNWLIENKYMGCCSISEITQKDLDGVTDSKIIRYLDYLKESGIRLNTLTTKKNQLSSFWQWLKWLWSSLLIRYWLHLKSKLDKHHLNELIIELQALYYMKRIEELEQELRKIEDELQLHDNKTLMDSLSDHSMMILKNTFHASLPL